MHIEIFFVPGCPNHEPAVESLRKVLFSEAVNASIQEIPVTDKRWHGRSSFRVPLQYASMDAM
jgi:hypothetical protein